MPDEKMWASFFDPERILKEMGVTGSVRTVVDLGSGYGTFTLSAANLTGGIVHAFDMEPAMMAHLKARIEQLRLDNIVLHCRDFIAEGTGLPDESVDYVMLFNVMHHIRPLDLLKEARRILRPCGLVGIIHWRSDIETPRGPQLDIRPTPHQCRQYAEQAGFDTVSEKLLPPYHFGLLVQKRDGDTSTEQHNRGNLLTV